MKIRLIAAGLMAVLAIVGIVLVTNYVNTAEARALAEQEPREVHLVTAPVPAGTPVDELPEFLGQQMLPTVTVPENAVTDLAEHQGTVVGVDLVPGEILLASRLVDPVALEEPGTIPVPEGMQEITLQLSPSQVVGGQLDAGDTVGIFVSFPEGDDGAPRTTLEFHNVLVTAVQGAPVAAAPADPADPADPAAEGVEGAEDPNAAPPVPEGTILLTLAVDAAQAEEIVFASQFGTVWLSNEPEDALENENGATMEDFG